MRTTTAAFAIAAAAATVSGQTVQNYTSALDMEIDPNSVPTQLRATWCQGQTNTCNVLCGLDTASNDCVQSTLEYDCTCSSNNSAPGLQYYTQTIPFFVCRELYSQCIAQNAGNADGQDACDENINALCFEHDPPSAADVEDEDDDDESSSTSSAPTSTATQSSSQTSGTAAAETTGPSDNDDEDSAAHVNVAGSGAAAVAALGLLAALL
jgi:hypothetical protein